MWMAKQKRHPVRRPHERVIESVTNQSSRHGVKPHLIVLHDTESHDTKGLGDLKAIGNVFDNPAVQASAHVCVDAEGYSARYVTDDRKAWHCKAYNSISLGIEQIGVAGFTSGQWRARRSQRRKVAQYIAYWSKKYDIPIRSARGNPGKAGVTTHASLGAAGGGHYDPGKGFPFWSVLALARFYRRRGW